MRYPSFGLNSRETEDALPLAAALALLKSASAEPGSLLAYGNGRSYGDTCQNTAGSLIDMRGMRRILAFDRATGLIEAQAGIFLSDIIAHGAPHGWFPPVLPGTQFVTLGGAIANDVHGKNHHRRGTFGCHVEAFTLLRSDGQTYRCSRETNPGLFAATIGGMGLTGLILTATVRLRKVSSLDIEERITPFATLAHYFDLAEEADQKNEYAVAWIDQLASGRRAGRGLLITGNHVKAAANAPASAGTRLAVPFRLPVNVLGRPFLTLFNEAYFRRKGRPRAPHVTGHQGFFFPLDGVRDWNRLYGPQGLYQHQSVLPEATARQAVAELLSASRGAGHGSFLTVLKRFGAMRSPGLLSFPRPGYTLTLDFPNRGAGTLALLAELDRITVAAGGAVNPYKDARMGAATFERSFPKWRAVEIWRDPAFLSDFWRRTAMTLRQDGVKFARAAE